MNILFYVIFYVANLLKFNTVVIQISYFEKNNGDFQVWTELKKLKRLVDT